MNIENIQNNIENDVLKKIECGEVKMKPKSYFIVKAGILVFITFLTFVATTILVSFLIFSLNYRGDLFLLSFGMKGIYKFILVFPWYLLLINAFLLIFLDYLIRRFRFGYNSPLVYLFLATLVFVTLFSFLINFTSFHLRLSNFLESRKIPFAGVFYNDLHVKYEDRGAIKGIVSLVTDDYIILRAFEGENNEIKIFAPKNTKFSSFIVVGDEVYVAGETASGTEIVSYGVKKVKGR